MKYPKKCCRCGYCCLALTCHVGQVEYDVPERTACPGVRFNGARAKCPQVKHNLIPVGDGCCIKARAYKDGIEHDFASLPDQLKRRAVADLVRNRAAKADMEWAEVDLNGVQI